MAINERSLADVELEDRTEPETPETFDMNAFLAGVRPTRRSVKLYPQGHIIARLDQLAQQIDDTPADEDVDHLLDEFEQLKAQFHAGVTFVVEKRSSEWEKQFRKDTVKDLGLSKVVNVGKDGSLNGGSDEQRGRIVLEQLAEQIVEPAGVTADQLQQLSDTNEGELTKLALLMTDVNTRIAEAAEVFSRDFSRRRSGNRRTPGL